MIKNIFEIIISKIRKIDFRKLANLSSGEKISKQVYVVHVVNELLKLCDKQSKDIQILEDGNIHIYNGSYWQMIDKPIFQKLLMKVGIKMGVPEVTGTYHRFLEDLLKQLYAAADWADKVSERRAIINLLNGTLHVTSKGYELRDFNKEDYLRYQLSFPFDKDAECPKFIYFLNRVLPNESCQKVLLEYIAYAFTKGLKLEKMLVLLGNGANGKSVIYDIVKALFGEENISSLSLSGLTDPKSQSRANLGKSLLNYGSEMEGKVAEEALKKLISGEAIEVKEIYERIYEMQDYAKLMYNSNKLPKNILNGHSCMRRMIIIPFNETIREDEQNKTLAQEIIQDELPGILNLVLEALKRLLEQKNFTKSPKLEDTLAYYTKTLDTLSTFIEGSYVLDTNSKIYKNDFFSEYEKYCSLHRYEPLNRREINEKLPELNIISKEDSRGVYLKLRKI